MVHIAMATHSLKGTFPNRVLKISDDVIFQSISTKFCNFVCYTKKHLYAKFEQNRIRNKKVAKIGNDISVTSFLKIAQQFFVSIFYSNLSM